MASRVGQSLPDNGIRVVTEPIAGARSVSIGVLVDLEAMPVASAGSAEIPFGDLHQEPMPCH